MGRLLLDMGRMGCPARPITILLYHTSLPFGVRRFLMGKAAAAAPMPPFNGRFLG